MEYDTINNKKIKSNNNNNNDISITKSHARKISNNIKLMQLQKKIKSQRFGTLPFLLTHIRKLIDQAQLFKQYRQQNDFSKMWFLRQIKIKQNEIGKCVTLNLLFHLISGCKQRSRATFISPDIQQYNAIKGKHQTPV